eukprot:jgi/Psemu1/10533/gm1.10533_g
MTTSTTCNEGRSKCPSDVAAQGTIPDNDSQAAQTKNDGGSLPPKKSCKSLTPSNSAPKYITQEDNVPEESSETAARTNKVPAVLTQVGTVSDAFSDTVTTMNAEVGVQSVPPVVAAMVVPAANPKENDKQRKAQSTYAKAVPSLSEEDLDYPNHWRSVEENLGLALNGQMYANTEFVKALRLDLSTSFNQLMTKVYIVSKMSTQSPMKKKKKRELSLLWHVHGEREVGDTKPCLYDCNVVNYVTIKKYMVVSQEILVWYMENVVYPWAPENMEKDLRFYTKCDDSSSHGSQDYVAVMKQLLDDLIANLALRASMTCGEQMVKQGFHQGSNMPSTAGQVLLPIHVLSVFHFVLHYKDLVTNLYHIHFDFDKNIITLSPSKIGKGKNFLAPAAGKILLTEEIASVDGACNECMSEVLCAFMLAENVALVGLFDSSCKAILQKVLKLPHTGSFGLEDSQFEDKEYKGFQHDDCLYIYPPPRGGVETQCSHVRFDHFHPEELIKGLLEIPGLGHIHQSVTQFLQCDVGSQQELHQWIFMEHIPYVFHEIFVTDLELSAKKRKIIYPVNRTSCRNVVDQSVELFTKKLEVVFLSQTNVQDINKHFGGDNEVYLSGVFKHLEDSKADLQNFKKSHPGPYAAGFVMFTSKNAESLLL